MSTAWAVTLYHDEPDNASENVTTVPGYFTSEDAALKAGRRSLTGYWQTGDIGIGDYTPPDPGVRPETFDYDEDATPLRFGPDWAER